MAVARGLERTAVVGATARQQHTAPHHAAGGSTHDHAVAARWEAAAAAHGKQEAAAAAHAKQEAAAAAQLKGAVARVGWAGAPG
ncbi:hypothetical protein E0H73_20920 [Kribbella pittospori]|uniref:Uncharacterized protein n=1 Tax=Kribbella pittospori TaxID=722689 RepID=A0A4R0KQA6_9ACTN|nr:hypothetical protein E0H73_20920 [Kribbella pittospori]